MNKHLYWAGILTAIIAMTHVAMVIGGAEWYRFFGAGEGMARQAEAGMVQPVIITLSIAVILGIWSLYAFSGAGMIGRLPFLKPVLILISSIFLIRGFLGIPLVILIEHPYLNELKADMTFMVVSSLICLGFGFLYVKGTLKLNFH